MQLTTKTITLNAKITFDLNELLTAIRAATASDGNGRLQLNQPEAPLGQILADANVPRACFLMFDSRPQYRASYIQVVASKEMPTGVRSSCRWWFPRTHHRGVGKDFAAGHWSTAFNDRGFMHHIAPLSPPSKNRFFNLESAYRDGLPSEVWNAFQDQIDEYVQGDKWVYPMASPNGPIPPQTGEK